MKKHSKQDAATTLQNKKANAPKQFNKQRQQALNEARQLAYLIHDDLHMTFAQCVQLIYTNYDDGFAIANKNITKINNKNSKDKDYVPIALFDKYTFNILLAKKLAWAKTAAAFEA